MRHAHRFARASGPAFLFLFFQIKDFSNFLFLKRGEDNTKKRIKRRTHQPTNAPRKNIPAQQLNRVKNKKTQKTIHHFALGGRGGECARELGGDGEGSLKTAERCWPTFCFWGAHAPPFPQAQKSLGVWGRVGVW